MKRVKPQDFWDGKTSVYSSKRIARATNKIARFLMSLQPYEREAEVKKLKEMVGP